MSNEERFTFLGPHEMRRLDLALDPDRDWVRSDSPGGRLEAVIDAFDHPGPTEGKSE